MAIAMEDETDAKMIAASTRIKDLEAALQRSEKEANAIRHERNEELKRSLDAANVNLVRVKEDLKELKGRFEGYKEALRDFQTTQKSDRR